MRLKDLIDTNLTGLYGQSHYTRRLNKITDVKTWEGEYCNPIMSTVWTAWLNSRQFQIIPYLYLKYWHLKTVCLKVSLSTNNLWYIRLIFAINLSETISTLELWRRTYTINTIDTVVHNSPIDEIISVKIKNNHLFHIYLSVSLSIVWISCNNWSTEYNCHCKGKFPYRWKTVLYWWLDWIFFVC